MYEGTEFFRKPYFSSNFTMVLKIFSSPCFLEGWFLAYFLPSFLTACPFLKYAFPEVPQPRLQSSAMVGQLELAGISRVWHRTVLAIPHRGRPAAPTANTAEHKHLSWGWLNRDNTQYTENQRQAKNMNSIVTMSKTLVSRLWDFLNQNIIHTRNRKRSQKKEGKGEKKVKEVKRKRTI